MSAAKGNTTFGYDAVGNLTSVIYSSGATSNIFYGYDDLNRLTSMSDGVGPTAFTWTDGGQLAGEDGPWSDDAVNYVYDNVERRSGLNLTQPNASPWTQSYSYDAAMRLSGVLSPAGSFTYTYQRSPAGDWVRTLYTAGGNVNGIQIQNYFDGLARLTNSTLSAPETSPFLRPTVQMQYAYDQNSQRTQDVFFVDSVSGDYSYKNYTYDNIGQLKTANGFDRTGSAGSYVDTPRLPEQFGYAYDSAWNLSQRTNNALVQSFAVNNLNELTGATRSGSLTVAGTATELRGGISGSPVGVTNVTVTGTGLSSGPAEIYHDGDWARAGAAPADGTNSYTAMGQDTYGRTSQNTVTVNLPASSTFSYDLNGNLLSDGTRNFAYDDENQLVTVWVANTWSNSFFYDGLMRKRIERQYGWQSSGNWQLTNEVHYVYDGPLVIQERDANNLALVTYTRGNDLSGSLQNAGGIGGLLARTDNGQMMAGNSTASAYYFSDINGNVSALVYTNGMTAARYSYDPYGNLLTMSGPLAAANKYRFSSKEWNDAAVLYYYGYRFYDPNLQRWLNRDPIGEEGGINLYEMCYGDPIDFADLWGLQCGFATPEEAAKNVLQKVDPTSIKDNLEYGGLIQKDKPTGLYVATKPVKGGDQGVNPADAKTLKGAAIVGDYHTHGDYSTEDPKTGKAIRTPDPNQDQFNSDHFSPPDKSGITADANKNGKGYKGYLGTPSKAIKQFDPSTGKEKTIGTCSP